MRLTPRANCDEIEGWARDEAGRAYLKVRVRAQPVDGQANTSLEKVLAAALGLPKSAVSVERGGASRVKQVGIEGLDAAQVASRLAAPR